MALKARLMDAEALRRSLWRMAHEILERGGGAEGLVLVGIPRRGPILAERLARMVQEIEGAAPPVLAVDPRPYRDDLERVEIAGVSEERLTGRRVVLVDDVLFTGRTVRAAMEAVLRLGRPRVVELLVVVDRGHRELPIRPDYVGKNVPTALREEVALHVVEIDGVDEVLLLEQNESTAVLGG
jgi:pyrimidine operon attenuation protein/uracil phosphoribosyltransferase